MAELDEKTNQGDGLAPSVDENKAPHVSSDSNNGAENDGVVGDDAEVVCPPHTTEGKLMWKVDYHVVPWLCIMYLLAFLGELIPL